MEVSAPLWRTMTHFVSINKCCKVNFFGQSITSRDWEAGRKTDRQTLLRVLCLTSLMCYITKPALLAWHCCVQFTGEQLDHT